MSTQPEFGDDWMAIAEAVADMPAREVGPILHPAVRKHLTDLALELLLRKWSAEVEIEDLDPDVPIPFALVHDDGECAGGCGRTVCNCVVACKGTVDQGPCDHGWRLCDDCRLHCDECRANLDGDVQ